MRERHTPNVARQGARARRRQDGAPLAVPAPGPTGTAWAGLGLPPAHVLAGLTVEEVAQAWPGTVRAFARRRMACVGCEAAALDTVADAARAYGVPLDVLLDELRAAAEG